VFAFGNMTVAISYLQAFPFEKVEWFYTRELCIINGFSLGNIFQWKKDE
jgi:hypothetical protein